MKIRANLYSANRNALYGFSIASISPGSISLVAIACLPILPPSSLISTALLQEGYNGLQSSIFRVDFSGSSMFLFSGIFGPLRAN